ncbi:hypothetical protein [Fontivita pretiosa]|uniref:hypothetical protein n=1 Tax=Fontivita pretiosa TaxID=2989684 RepID=UPI003D16990B
MKSHGPAMSGPTLETLESRTLLAATTFLNPLTDSQTLTPGLVQMQPGDFVYQPEPELDDLVTRGRSRFFILEPGRRMVYHGQEDAEQVRLVIAVTDRTRLIDGVRTRVVREVEHVNGELIEVSWNYLAMDEDNGDLFYFGEDVNIYEDGKLVSHEGAWRSGVNGARFGLLMPGDPQVGMTFLQERAPGVALDEGHIVNLNSVVRTPLGRFRNCAKVEETSALEPGAVSIKYHAPGVGLVQDGVLKLTAIYAR